MMNYTKALNFYFANEFTQKYVAAKFGIKSGTFSIHARNDIRYNGPRGMVELKTVQCFTAKQKLEAVNRLRKQETAVEIAKSVGCSTNTLATWENNALAKKNAKDQKATKAMFPEMEKMRKDMFDSLQLEFVSLTSIIEETETKRQYVHDKMALLGEQWN